MLDCFYIVYASRKQANVLQKASFFSHVAFLTAECKEMNLVL